MINHLNLGSHYIPITLEEVINIEAHCAAPLESLAHSPSHMPLSCPVAPPSQRVASCAKTAAVFCFTQALHDLNLPEEDIRVLNKIIPDFLFDLQGAGEAFEDMKQMGLSGAQPLGEAKTKAPNPTTTRTSHRSRQGRLRLRGTTSSARRGSTSSTAIRRGRWSPRSRDTTGAGCWSS